MREERLEKELARQEEQKKKEEESQRRELDRLETKRAEEAGKTEWRELEAEAAAEAKANAMAAKREAIARQNKEAAEKERLKEEARARRIQDALDKQAEKIAVRSRAGWRPCLRSDFNSSILTHPGVVQVQQWEDPEEAAPADLPEFIPTALEEVEELFKQLDVDGDGGAAQRFSSWCHTGTKHSRKHTRSLPPFYHC